jgi:hypothetical protein
MSSLGQKRQVQGDIAGRLSAEWSDQMRIAAGGERHAALADLIRAQTSERV